MNTLHSKIVGLRVSQLLIIVGVAMLLIAKLVNAQETVSKVATKEVIISADMVTSIHTAICRDNNCKDPEGHVQKYLAAQIVQRESAKVQQAYLRADVDTQSKVKELLNIK